MDNYLSIQEATSNVTQSKESFTFSCLSNRGGVACDKNSHTDEFEPNCDQNEHELYFDVDITLPFRWKLDSLNTSNNYPYMNSPCSIVLGNSNICHQDTGEFEFSITFSDNAPSSNGFPSAFSPADDLFYKGRLLPLQLPPRLRMVEQLSSLESNITELELEEEDYGCLSANGDNDVFTPSILELIDKQRCALSCQSSLVEEDYRLKEPNSTMVRSSGAWVNMTRVQDANVFPDCYKDPTLQMLQRDVDCKGAKGYAKPSIGWSLFLPGSRRLSCQKLAIWQDSFPGCDTRKAKEAHLWGGFSVLKLRASASFFKSLFHTGELGRSLVHQKGHHRHCREAKEVVAAEANGQEEARNFASVASCGAYVADGIDKQPLNSASAQEERDKLIRKARGYLQKYVRLFKSMYVSMSHSNHEQSRNQLLESSSTVEDISIACRFSTCTSKKGIVNVEPKALRTTSFSRRPKTNGGSIVDDFHQNCGLSKAKVAGCSSVDNGSAGSETENRIQGAIAHCKQSSSLTAG